MGIIVQPEQVKLFAGIISASGELADKAVAMLQHTWGAVDCVSAQIPFTFTEYYRTEMGGNLIRRWVGFDPLVSPGALADLKLYSNSVERTFALAGARQVNIDPGYISPAKLVLASTKDYSHRIYLDKGIYAEVTMIYQNHAFVSLPWTYPDYQCAEAQAFFHQLRSRYRAQIKAFRELGQANLA